MKTVRQFFLETLDAEAPKFVRVLEAIPPDQAGYRPHPRCSSTGGIVWLLASELGDMLFGCLFDAIHHRGQLSSYLRPMGGKVPSI